MRTAVRPPAVAGTFYPGSAAELSRTVDALLAAHVASPGAGRAPKAIIAPHAGYIYSGPVAGAAFATLRALRGQVRRVVLIGPAHRMYVRGLALPDADAMATPLGNMPIDATGMVLRGVGNNAAAHAREHALEVELPFVQRALGDVSVVPLVVGDADPREVAHVLDVLWGGPETCIIVSSDLSHYLPYDVAKRVDGATAERIVTSSRDPSQKAVAHDEACGATPINGLLEVVRARGLTPAILDLKTSGDTAGSRGEVVGYGAFAFYEVGEKERAYDVS